MPGTQLRSDASASPLPYGSDRWAEERAPRVPHKLERPPPLFPAGFWQSTMEPCLARHFREMASQNRTLAGYAGEGSGVGGGWGVGVAPARQFRSNFPPGWEGAATGMFDRDLLQKEGREIMKWGRRSRGRRGGGRIIIA